MSKILIWVSKNEIDGKGRRNILIHTRLTYNHEGQVAFDDSHFIRTPQNASKRSRMAHVTYSAAYPVHNQKQKYLGQLDAR